MKTTSIFFKAITFFCAAVLLFLCVTNLGAIKYYSSQTKKDSANEQTSVTAVNYNLDQEVLDAMKIAYDEAYRYVSTELDLWINEMLLRVDEDFLDEYFGFLQVKKREVVSIYNSIVHFFIKNKESAEAAAIRELEEEIEQKIIKPEIAQARINNITSNAITVYATVLDEQLIRVQQTYKIPVLEWNRYISGICGLTLDIENKSYPITFKALVVSGTALTGFIAAPIIQKVAVKVSGKFAQKAAVKIGTNAAIKSASKTVGKGAGNLTKTLPYVGWGITAALCVWEIVDYVNTSREGKEILRQNLIEYFREIKTELLSSTNQSIMGTITHWENGVKAQIAK